MRVNMKKTAATAAMCLGLGAAGLGSGIGQAAPGVPGPPIPPIPAPPIPGLPAMPNVQIPNVPMVNIPDDLMRWEGPNVNPAWLPGMPPGQNPFGPPGQVMKMATLPLPGGGVLNNPFFNIPPGQWGAVNLNPVDLTVQLPGGELAELIWDTAQNAWGYVVDGDFIRFPIQFPAPPAEG